MLKTRFIPILIFAILASSGAMAQKNKRNTRKINTQKTVVPEKTEEEKLYEEMLFSTAKVLFVDSVVTDKTDFLNHIMLGKESGTVTEYNSCFKDSDQPNAFVYTNEFGNKRYYSKTDATGHTMLYTTDKLGGKWSEPQLISEFEDEFEDINSPFMMTDGTTLYFSAKSKQGLGGYDIYVTRYDTDEAKFYKPENIGLPFNSFANDYYYAIDELNSLGWLVTDRNQPEGKVCIYTFVPSSSRQTYDEDMDEEKLDGLAKITSIKDTWNDGKERKDALARLDAMRNKPAEGNHNELNIMFIVNDDITYRSINDFKSQSSKEMFAKLMTHKDLLKETVDSLEQLRNRYADADETAKTQMRNDIINTEKAINSLEEKIKSEEKSIRNIENSTF